MIFENIGVTYTPKKTTVKFRDGPDSSFAGYPAILKTGYRISGGCRIPDISMPVRCSTELLK